MNELTRTTITSMEAAEWCGKEHAKLLRRAVRRIQNWLYRFLQGIYIRYRSEQDVTVFSGHKERL